MHVVMFFIVAGSLVMSSAFALQASQTAHGFAQASHGTPGLASTGSRIGQSSTYVKRSIVSEDPSWTFGGQGEDCDTVCASANGECDQEAMDKITTGDAMTAALQAADDQALSQAMRDADCQGGYGNTDADYAPYVTRNRYDPSMFSKMCTKIDQGKGKGLCSAKPDMSTPTGPAVESADAADLPDFSYYRLCPCSTTGVVMTDLTGSGGYCKKGYYGGNCKSGSPSDEDLAACASLEACQAQCLKEERCKFLAFKPLVCSRYDDRAGDCSDRKQVGSSFKVFGK